MSRYSKHARLLAAIWLTCLVCGPQAASAQLFPLPPPTRPDVEVKKVRAGSDYIMTVTNVGVAIPVPGRIELADEVPSRIYIARVTAPAPWRCRPLPPPVVRGPATIKCEYQFATLARGPLPNIVLRRDGTSQRPNCVTVRLYAGPVGRPRLLSETDTRNNTACEF